jgi:hypothetical protein
MRTNVRRRSLTRLLALPLLLAAAAPAWAQEATELPWTRVAKADLERFEAAAGGVRVNNLVVELQKDADPAGPATPFELSASVANRSADRLRVYVEMVGVKADGTPTFSCNSSVDVDSRRNDSIRETFRARPGALEETVAYYVRALAVP